MYDRAIISLCKDDKDQKVLILYPRIAENDVNVKELLSFDLAKLRQRKCMMRLNNGPSASRVKWHLPVQFVLAIKE